MFTDFNYDSEISKELAQTVSKYLIDNSNFHSHYQSIKNNTVDALTHWETYAELGWLLAPARDENNGIGCTSYDLACMQVEMGKHLALEPFTTHCLAVQLIESSDNSTLKETVLPLMLAGKNLCAFAIFERASRYSLDNIETEFKQNKNGSFNICGVKHYVSDIQNVTHILVLAHDNQTSEKCWFCIPVNHLGISFNFYLGTDDKPMADLTFDVRELDSKFKISLNTTDLQVTQLLNQANILNNADSLGCCIQLLNLTAQYLLDRKQFNSSLSSFQSLQHIVADMFIALQRVLSLTFYQAQSVDTLLTEHAQERIYITNVELFENTQFIFEKAIQLHGGIGVTEELSVGHLAKRIITNNCRYGDKLFFLSQIE
ncbi:acyl-CoA dehydrogenase family protein [Brumicola pallidula]|uniref:Acyl-CoA dehydrogenase/oxidase C-terminal domain-containing protein n=1 Tax=Brumicola pallidula DSM 14239 = ACAM 615 TaxID=1121922 RepID=K6Y8H2_9ALTE|nr:acyl-CoA dehydrogenase family protein [Glaciecola pallidula]GAC29054.1 hypothetical protein GPAL_2193 [Glaciecola pallidula DSM 14239 = ACAM 615]